MTRHLGHPPVSVKAEDMDAVLRFGGGARSGPVYVKLDIGEAQGLINDLYAVIDVLDEKTVRCPDCLEATGNAGCKTFCEPHSALDWHAGQTFDCPHCADGDALLEDEACAYCGLVNGPDGEAAC